MGGFNVKLHQLPLIGNFVDNPNEAFKQQQFDQAARAYGAYRPERAQAVMSAFRGASTGLQGANDLLSTFTGGKMRGIDPTQMFRNPMGPSMMTQGQGLNPPQQGGGGGGLGSLFGGGGIPGMGGGGLGGLFGGM
jgi:hypothetical protein